MNRINNSGWPALIDKNVIHEGLVHHVDDAYGGRGGTAYDGNVMFACETGYRILPRYMMPQITDGPVTCFACMAGGVST